ncbi:MAG: hypothetical protein HW418_981 [Anaerolineales bacterium]|nr:hypothetical protein [Anaerolineales bacterium]
MTWLALVRGQANIGLMLAGLAVLAVGFTIEHLLAYNVIHERGLLDLRGVPIGQKAVVSVIETAIWALWLALAELNAIVAAIVLAGLLIVEHTLSDNVFKHKGLFARLIDGRTIGFSLIEAVGAAIWLALVEASLAVVGIVILVVASFIEHSMAVALGRKDTVRA